MGQIFVFGVGHVDPVNGQSLDGHYVEAPDDLDERSARIWMIEHFGLRWASQYDDLDDAGVRTYGLARHEVHNPALFPDHALRVGMGRLYWDIEWWRMVAIQAANELEAGRPAAEIAKALRKGWVNL